MLRASGMRQILTKVQNSITLSVTKIDFLLPKKMQVVTFLKKMQQYFLKKLENSKKLDFFT